MLEERLDRAAVFFAVFVQVQLARHHHFHRNRCVESARARLLRVRPWLPLVLFMPVVVMLVMMGVVGVVIVVLVVVMIRDRRAAKCPPLESDRHSPSAWTSVWPEASLVSGAAFLLWSFLCLLQTWEILGLLLLRRCLLFGCLLLHSFTPRRCLLLGCLLLHSFTPRRCLLLGCLLLHSFTLWLGCREWIDPAPEFPRVPWTWFIAKSLGCTCAIRCPSWTHAGLCSVIC